MTISIARKIAFDALLRVATQAAYADEALRAMLDESVGAADAGLATELTMGVLRWQRLLDFLIDRSLTKAVKTLDIEVRIALRMGIYQLRFLDRVPAHAAVHESVELVKKVRKRSAAPLVNAVLRKAAREVTPSAMPDQKLASLIASGRSSVESLGIQTSHPDWLVERWLRTFGDDRTRALLAANNRVPVTSAYLLRPELREQALASLLKAGCMVKPGLLLRDAWTVHGGNPSAAEATQKDWIAMQDEASQAVAHIVAVEPGNSVLDLCAAPGGKTLILSLAAGKDGRVLAGDLHTHRVRAMSDRFARAGRNNIESQILDGTAALPFTQKFDRILVDVPCSGTGTLARHPEVRWTLRAEDLTDLHIRQVKLLGNALGSIAQGGRIVYSTCSLEPEENELVVQEALQQAQGKFNVVPVQPTLSHFVRDDLAVQNLVDKNGYFRTSTAEIGTDGFFAAAMEPVRQ